VHEQNSKTISKSAKVQSPNFNSINAKCKVD